MDGFIKTGDDCLVIIPSVFKLIPGSKSVAKDISSTSIIGNLGHLKEYSKSLSNS